MISIASIHDFQSALRAISNFISEGNFRLNDRGLFFKAIDPSQVVLVSYEAPKEFFEEYSIEPGIIGVDVEEFNKVVKRASASDKILLDVEETYLKVIIKGDFERTFKLPLMDIFEEEPELPEQEFDAKVEINAKQLQELLKDASLFESSVVFRIAGNEFIIEAKGSQGSLAAKAKSNAAKIEAKKDVIGKYSLNFLENIVKEAPASDTIVLELKNEAPMRISYNIGNSKIEFYLAHMIL